jgi:hypothetical protein
VLGRSNDLTVYQKPLIYLDIPNMDATSFGRAEAIAAHWLAGDSGVPPAPTFIRERLYKPGLYRLRWYRCHQGQ